MRDRDKDKERLLNELMEVRKKITELEDIKTSQKQTEKKLAKSEELFSLIVKNTSDVITLHDFNLQATFTYISPSIIFAPSVPERQCGGKRLNSLSPGRW
ncbi:hypothetical protein ES705_35637 [subsurface metagenome]